MRIRASLVESRFSSRCTHMNYLMSSRYTQPLILVERNPLMSSPLGTCPTQTTKSSAPYLRERLSHCESTVASVLQCRRHKLRFTASLGTLQRSSIRKSSTQSSPLSTPPQCSPGSLSTSRSDNLSSHTKERPSKYRSGATTRMPRSGTNGPSLFWKAMHRELKSSKRAPFTTPMAEATLLAFDPK